MQFEIRPFELKHKRLPPKKGVLLHKEGRFSEVSPFPGRSTETLEEAVQQLHAVQKGWKGPLYPSVEFGLYGLLAPPVMSIPCALFLYGTPDEVLNTDSHGCTSAKLKVGHWNVGQALSVIQALPFKLRLDFNLQWKPSDIEELCAQLSPAQIEFLEDAGITVPGFTTAYDERISLKSLNVWKPMIRGLPTSKQPIILSSSLESSIGLHQIATLIQTHKIPSHALGLGTITHLENDLVQNSAYLKDGKLHFPLSWSLC